MVQSAFFAAQEKILLINRKSLHLSCLFTR
jgi:hypothetical protein